MSAVVATDMLAVTDVVRTFGSGRTATRALRGVSFGVRAGQLVALRGRSGSGKTTLLNIVGGLDLPDSGQVRLGDRDVTAMSGHERMELRRSSVAFIFQSFGLIPILSAAMDTVTESLLANSVTSCPRSAQSLAASSTASAQAGRARAPCRSSWRACWIRPGSWRL